MFEKACVWCEQAERLPVCNLLELDRAWAAIRPLSTLRGLKQLVEVTLWVGKNTGEPYKKRCLICS